MYRGYKIFLLLIIIELDFYCFDNLVYFKIKNFFFLLNYIAMKNILKLIIDWSL